MIVYACTMNQSVTYMFAGSLIPGLLIAALLFLTNMVLSKRWRLESMNRQYTLREGLVLLWKSLGVLMLPVIVLGGIYGGICTPTEAAVIACIYTAVLGVAYGDLNMKKIIEIVKQSAASSAVLSVVLGAAGLFGWILSATRIPTIRFNIFPSSVSILSYAQRRGRFCAFRVLAYFLGNAQHFGGIVERHDSDIPLGDAQNQHLVDEILH